QPLPQCPGELVTVGLDKLAERLKKYYEQGARFAKWRAVLDIAPGIPTMTAISVNAHALARYAALCQQAQIVPIVEPEVLMDGDHNNDRCFDVTSPVPNKTFSDIRIPRVAGGAAAGVVRQGRQHRGGTAGLYPSRADELAREQRRMESRPGTQTGGLIDGRKTRPAPPGAAALSRDAGHGRCRAIGGEP